MSLKQQPAIKYRKDYQPSQFLIKKTQLTFQLAEDHTLVRAELLFERNPLDQRDTIEPLQLDGKDLQLQSIAMDDLELPGNDFELNEQGLLLLRPKEKFTLTTQVKIEPHKNTSLEGLYRSGDKYCTQCEAEGFRKITFYLDKPEIMSEFRVRIEADKHRYPLLLSNGNPIASGELSEGRHYVEWHDPFPKPSYLFALVAGDLDLLEDEFITMSGRKVRLQLYVDKGKLDQCDYAMDSLKRAMKWDEEKYGREYDLDLYMIVAVGDFNMGAMENKGLNIFNTKYVLANNKTATDADFEGVERVIAHEYFHNWTGNRVTCRDWFQLSLKEGLTVFRDQQFSEDMRSKPVQRIDQVKIIRSAQFAEDSGPMAHPIRPDSYIEMNNFYTVTVYNKGAEVIRMMHTMLGESGFRAGMDLYFERHDGQAVTCEDFVRAMEDANKIDWKQFRLWYSQAGTPSVKVSLEKLSDTRWQLTASQSCPPTPGQEKKAPMLIPIKWGLLNAEGQRLNFRDSDMDDFQDEMLWLVTDSESSLVFETETPLTDKPIPSLLRDFSAPVKLDYPYSEAELTTLFGADPNAFNRWDAGQNLMASLLLADTDQLSEEAINSLCEAIKQVLDDEELDNEIKALAVQLPSLSELIGRSERVKADQLFDKYRTLKKTLGQQLEHTWFSIYTTTPPKSAGDRWLKNVALDYMMIADESKHLELATNQLEHADNMTEELGALQVIANTSQGYQSEYIQHFYEKWKDEDLVMDKWFAAQVKNDSEEILEHVKNLMLHPKFSLTNPNKVRSVITTFVAANLPQFHHPRGTGYEFLANIIIRLNEINPQVAAGLAKQFNQWKKLDDNRQALIKEQLDRILATPNLSDDVFEVVSKSANQ